MKNLVTLHAHSFHPDRWAEAMVDMDHCLLVSMVGKVDALFDIPQNKGTEHATTEHCAE
jgi:hypothetical protein